MRSRLGRAQASRERGGQGEARQLEAVELIIPPRLFSFLPSRGARPHVDLRRWVAPVYNLLGVYEAHVARLTRSSLHVLPARPIILVRQALGFQDVALRNQTIMHAPEVDPRAVTKTLPQLCKPVSLLPFGTVTGVKRVVLWRENQHVYYSGLTPVRFSNGLL